MTHFGDDFLAHTYVVASKTNHSKLYLGTERFTVTLQRKQRNPTLRNAVDTPPSFQRLSTGGLSVTSFPHWDQVFRARCSTSRRPRTNWNTQAARVHPHLLGPRGSTWHSWTCLLGLHALTSVTLSSPGSLLLLSLLSLGLLKSCVAQGYASWWLTCPPGFSYHLRTPKALPRGQTSLLNFRLMSLRSDSTAGPAGTSSQHSSLTASLPPVSFILIRSLITG